MAGDQKRIPALLYLSQSGKQPIRDWLMKLELADRKTIGTDIKTVEFGWPLPTCRAMGKGLYEARSSLVGGRVARVLLYLQRPDGAAVWIYKEVAEDIKAGARSNIR